MALSNEFEKVDGYVHVRVTGEEESPSEYHEQVRKILEYCEVVQCFNVLVDETKAISCFTVKQEYELSNWLLDNPLMAKIKRIAWIGKSDKYELAKVFEGFALIQDVQFQAFRRREAAERWLRGGPL
ncbi:MAG: hypothetical protein KC477_14795 [Oceanospirillaceae bacterium]|nr:hypothetical protein [Oceanospirillaceae bacterium]